MIKILKFIVKGGNERKMQKTKKCPKCGSEKLTKFSEKSHGTMLLYGAGGTVSHWIACLDCGYCERWLSDKEIRQHSNNIETFFQ